MGVVWFLLDFLSISVWRCSYKSVAYKKACTTLGKMSIEEYCLYHFLNKVITEQTISVRIIISEDVSIV